MTLHVLNDVILCSCTFKNGQKSYIYVICNWPLLTVYIFVDPVTHYSVNKYNTQDGLDFVHSNNIHTIFQMLKIHQKIYYNR